MSFRLIIFTVILCISGVGHALEITHVYHEPEMILPAKGEMATIHFTLSNKSNVIINIFDERSFLIRKIKLSSLSSGVHQANWDGKDQNGQIVPPEAYTYTINATDSNGTVIYDLSDYTGDQQYKMSDVKWNNKLMQFEYTINKPSRVFIRVGLDNHGPLLATILEWVPRTSGKQTEKWDGEDASGVLDLANHPKMLIDMQTYKLSRNSILVGPKISKSNYIKDIPFGGIKRQVKHQQRKMMFAANQQAPETRGDYTVQLKLPDDLKKNKQGAPIINGVVRVVLDVDDAHREIAIDRRSESVLFVDGQFAMENELGFLPVTWHLDTSKMNVGEHFLTVNLRGYDGNFGIGTTKVYVQHKKEVSTGQ